MPDRNDDEDTTKWDSASGKVITDSRVQQGNSK